jgi:hypothetical protein
LWNDKRRTTNDERRTTNLNVAMACDETTKVQSSHKVTSLLTAEAGAGAVPKRVTARATAKGTAIFIFKLKSDAGNTACDRFLDFLKTLGFAPWRG